MMSKLIEEEMEEIRKKIAEEFPDDPALQQVHIARKIIAREAELQGLSFLKYVKTVGKHVNIAKKS